MNIQKITLPGGAIRWEVKIAVGGRGSQQLRRRFRTRDDAQAFGNEIESRKIRERKLESSIHEFEETTIQREYDYWLSVKQHELKPSYLARVKGIAAELMPLYGHLNPLAFHVGKLTSIRAELRERGRNRSPATINRMMTVLTGFLAHSCNNCRIPYNPAAKFKKLKEAKVEISFWEEHEATEFLAFADRKYPEGSERRWVYLAYLLTLNTALRAGEVWGLSPESLLPGGDTIHVFQQLARTTQVLQTLKDHEERTVPCNPELHRELNAWISRNRLGEKDLIFRNQVAEGIDHDNFRRRIFEKDIRECQKQGGKVRRVRFHDLRHTAATLMISKGIDVPTVQKILGHEDISTTMRYVHALKDNIKKVAQTFAITPSREIRPEPTTSHLRLVK